jgi:hypothetical protein
MFLKLANAVFYLVTASLALAQNPTQAADTFHIASCASPCIAQLALSQTPVGDVTIYLNGTQLDPSMYQIDSSNGPQTIIVTFSTSAGAIQDTDLIVASYPVDAATNPTTPADPPV